MKYVKIKNGVVTEVSYVKIEGYVKYTNDDVFEGDTVNADGTFTKRKKGSEEKRDEVRARRNELLQETDHTQVPDHPLAGNADLLSYRQSLRDITKQTGEVVWPKRPAVLQ